MKTLFLIAGLLSMNISIAQVSDSYEFFDFIDLSAQEKSSYLHSQGDWNFQPPSTYTNKKGQGVEEWIVYKKTNSSSYVLTIAFVTSGLTVHTLTLSSEKIYNEWVKELKDTGFTFSKIEGEPNKYGSLNMDGYIVSICKRMTNKNIMVYEISIIR